MPSPTEEPELSVQDLQLSLCDDVLADLAPAERMLVPAAVDAYARDPGRYREDPAELASAGGGELGGAGIGETVQFLLPYVTALAGMGLQLVLQTVQTEAGAAVASGVRRFFRRRKSRAQAAALAAVGPLTAAQLDQLAQMISEYGKRWQLPAEDLTRIRVALLDRFAAQFGRA